MFLGCMRFVTCVLVLQEKDDPLSVLLGLQAIYWGFYLSLSAMEISMSDYEELEEVWFSPTL